VEFSPQSCRSVFQWPKWIYSIKVVTSGLLQGYVHVQEAATSTLYVGLCLPWACLYKGELKWNERLPSQACCSLNKVTSDFCHWVCLFSGSQHHDWVFPIASGNAIETQYTIFFCLIVSPMFNLSRPLYVVLYTRQHEELMNEWPTSHCNSGWTWWLMPQEGYHKFLSFAVWLAQNSHNSFELWSFLSCIRDNLSCMRSCWYST
jgi:hypothetical protein